MASTAPALPAAPNVATTIIAKAYAARSTDKRSGLDRRNKLRNATIPRP
jgi:hypothetical protein